MLIAYLLLSLLVAVIGNNKQLGFMWGLLLSLILSPLIGLIIVLASGNKPEAVNSDIEALKAEIEALKKS